MRAEELFRWDFARHSDKPLGRAVLTPNDLFWDASTEGLLRLCGMPEERFDHRASDYDRFSAFCQASPLLTGHPQLTLILRTLNSHCGVERIPDAAQVPQLWESCCDRLLHAEKRQTDLFPQGESRLLCDPDRLPTPLPEYVRPVMEASRLLSSPPKTLSEWQERVTDAVVRFRAAGGDTVFLSLRSDFVFVRPNPYHVGEALCGRLPTREAGHLLTAQLFRMLSAACVGSEMGMLLELLAPRREVEALLGYTEQAVGLPVIGWMTSDPDTRDGMLSRARLPGGQGLYWVLNAADTPTKASRQMALRELAARYPIGRLRLFLGEDFRKTSAAREMAMDWIDQNNF